MGEILTVALVIVTILAAIVNIIVATAVLIDANKMRRDTIAIKAKNARMKESSKRFMDAVENLKKLRADHLIDYYEYQIRLRYIVQESARELKEIENDES